MTKPNLFFQYSVVAVAALALAACGSDRNRTARNNANNSTETAQNTATGMGGNANRTADNSADRATGGNLSSSDRDFVTKAARGGMAEVEIARLAETKASSPRVKEYARQLVEDHTMANEELKRIAANDNVALPANLDSSDRSELEKLNGLSGARFDQEFMKHTVDDHKDDIKDFEKQADKGTDPALKSFASNTLPKLRHHLEMAQNIHSSQKGNADRSSR